MSMRNLWYNTTVSKMRRNLRRKEDVGMKLVGDRPSLVILDAESGTKTMICEFCADTVA